MAAWVRTGPGGSGVPKRVFGGDDSAWSCGIRSTGLRFTTWLIRDYDLATTYPIDQWFHLAFVFDAAHDVTFYIDGTLAGTVVGYSPATSSAARADARPRRRQRCDSALPVLVPHSRRPLRPDGQPDQRLRDRLGDLIWLGRDRFTSRKGVPADLLLARQRLPSPCPRIRKGRIGRDRGVVVSLRHRRECPVDDPATSR